MFLVHDTLEERQKMILSCEDPFIAVLLAAADFEWTIRRAILALGTRETKTIKDEVLARCFGLDGYKEAWMKEVQPLTDKGLTDIIPNWQYFREQAYPLRNRLIHGIEGTVTPQYAKERVAAFLSASKALAEFDESCGEPVYGRKIIRLKRRGWLRKDLPSRKKS